MQPSEQLFPRPAQPKSPCTQSVPAVRAVVLEGLASVKVFAEAVFRTNRTINLWIARGLPIVRIGKTPYIRVGAARDWLHAHNVRPDPSTVA